MDAERLPEAEREVFRMTLRAQGLWEVVRPAAVVQGHIETFEEAARRKAEDDAIKSQGDMEAGEVEKFHLTDPDGQKKHRKKIVAVKKDGRRARNEACVSAPVF